LPSVKHACTKSVTGLRLSNICSVCPPTGQGWKQGFVCHARSQGIASRRSLTWNTQNQIETWGKPVISHVTTCCPAMQKSPGMISTLGIKIGVILVLLHYLELQSQRPHNFIMRLMKRLQVWDITVCLMRWTKHGPRSNQIHSTTCACSMCTMHNVEHARDHKWFCRMFWAFLLIVVVVVALV
jgi:hypothetical protein